MAQRVFDIENEKDYADLWDILQDRIIKLVKPCMCEYPYPKYVLAKTSNGEYEIPITINWHDKTEITRPIQECTEADIGKICAFWDVGGCYYGVLTNIIDDDFKYKMYESSSWKHCRRLTKQEIEELC